MRYWQQAEIADWGTRSSHRFQFTQLADTLTPIPGGQGTFRHFGLGQPAIYRDRVVFWAAGQAGQVGLYQVEAQKLRGLVNNHPTLSNQPHRFTAFGSTPALDRDNVLFLGQDQKGCLRLYQGTHDRLVPLVETNRVVLEGGNFFINLSNPAVQAGYVTFLARLATDHRKGIFRYAQGQLRTIALAEKSALSLLDLSIPAVDQSGCVVFRGENHHYQSGIYRLHQQQMQVLVSTTTPIPEGIGCFKAFSDPLIDRGCVFFRGSGSVFQQGIYRWDKTGLHKIVDSQTLVPDSLETFSKFQSFAISEEQMAFLAQDSYERMALFLATAGTVIKVVEIGDRLDNKPIVGLSIGRFSLHRRAIAFCARFVDGTEGLFKAEQQA